MAANQYCYVGNPGYAFRLSDGEHVLYPGDVVSLSAEEAAGAGGDFEPVKAKTAPTNETPSED